MRASIHFFICALIPGLVAAQELPPHILADQYLLEATKALEAENLSDALRAFEKIEALDVEPPPEFSYFYGKFLVEYGSTSGVLSKGERLLKSFVVSIKKDSQYYLPALALLTDASRKLEEIAEKEAEARARHEAKRKAEAYRLKEGCPKITGQFLYVDSHGYKRYLNIGLKLTPVSATYEFRRHDLLTSHNRPPPYAVRIGSSSVLRYEDPYEFDLTIDIAFQGKCNNGKLLVERKHNYDTPGWIINHPFIVWSTYQMVGEELHVRELTKMHPKDGGKTHDNAIMYRRIR